MHPHHCQRAQAKGMVPNQDVAKALKGLCLVCEPERKSGIRLAAWFRSCAESLLEEEEIIAACAWRRSLNGRAALQTGTM